VIAARLRPLRRRPRDRRNTRAWGRSESALHAVRAVLRDRSYPAPPRGRLEWAPPMISSACATAGTSSLSIARQGSFAVGRTVVTSPGTFDPAAQTPPVQPPRRPGRRCTRSHVRLIPSPRAVRRLPLVMWYGIGPFSKTWQTPDEQNWFGTFRLGVWPDFFPWRAVLARSGSAQPVLPADDAERRADRHRRERECDRSNRTVAGRHRRMEFGDIILRRRTSGRVAGGLPLARSVPLEIVCLGF